MIELDSISTVQKSDATFIRLLLQILYKSNINVLQCRTFSGNSISNRTTIGDSSQKKQMEAISPQKKQKIFSLFRERIVHADISTQDKFTRLKSTNIARLVAVGIANIRKRNNC